MRLAAHSRWLIALELRATNHSVGVAHPTTLTAAALHSIAGVTITGSTPTRGSARLPHPEQCAVRCSSVHDCPPSLVAARPNLTYSLHLCI